MPKNNNNPWKGLDSYSCSDASLFYGRSKETEALIDTIINNRFTVLYGPSGIGKTSLLNAGIRPKLTNNNYFVVNISMRLLDMKTELPIAAQIISTVRDCAYNDNIDITPLSKSQFEQNMFSDSLWHFFHTNEFWTSKNELLTPVIIIDQFEDLFKDGIKESIVESFFNNLDELSSVVPPLTLREKILDFESFRYNQSSDFRFVCSLREDYLPRLDDYVYSMNIPELRKSRYSLAKMSSSQAQEVILYPSKGIVSESVANKIITILAAQDNNNRSTDRIEPFLLSLFMYRVFQEMINRGLSSISEELINTIGSDVVNDFYLESMGKVSQKAMKNLEDVLLTSKGHRDSISIDRLIEGGKVTKEELDILLSDRILKKTAVNNVDRIEFTHDIIGKYALLNKNNRKQGIDFTKVSGILGAFVSVVLAYGIGRMMNAFLTYVSVPLLLSTFLLSTFSLVKIGKVPGLKKIAFFILALIVSGILIDLSQIIPGVGYISYVLSAILSLFITQKYRTNHLANATAIRTIIVSISIWLISITLIPFLCYGYNLYQGLNYARDEVFAKKTFYIKDNKGRFGLRNKDSIIAMPQYDTLFVSTNNGFVAKRDNKYGLIDEHCNDVLSFEYDGFKVEHNNVYFYLKGKEITKNGMGIKWHPDVKDDQKVVIRKIIDNMVFVEGGSFIMGTNIKKIQKVFPSYSVQNEEDHLHKAVLSDYYLNKYEVTLEEWKTIMEYDARFGINIHNDADTIDNPNLPVYKVSYKQCESFIERINVLSGLHFSLPSEAQWEYAARGGNKSNNYLYAGADSCSDVGWIEDNSMGFPHTIGCKKSNEIGLFDMTGNIAEYCKDYLSPNFYKESEGQENPCCNTTDLKGKSNMTKKKEKYCVVRGGSFRTNNEKGDCIVTKRIRAIEVDPYEAVGLRLALNIE